MRVAHWIRNFGSGLDGTAKAISEAEIRLGHESFVCNADDEATWAPALDADVHVCHAHFTDTVRKRLTRPARVVWVGHGTPEYSFQMSLDAGTAGAYGASDSWMLMQKWLSDAHARVTFWPRHQALYQTMVNRGTTIDLVPMGVDKEFWAPGASRGKWAGAPSLFTAENVHQGKSPLDLLFLWPTVAEALDEATLHVCNLPTDQHRWWFSLVNHNGAAFRSYLSQIRWGKDDLRNTFRSIDYFIGLVRYGDHNQLSHQANASGAKTISYRGNVYADYWLTEGDHRAMADRLIRILKGEIEPRAKEPVPDISDTARGMIGVYERVCGGDIAQRPLVVAGAELATILEQFPSMPPNVAEHFKGWTAPLDLLRDAETLLKKPFPRKRAKVKKRTRKARR